MGVRKWEVAEALLSPSVGTIPTQVIYKNTLHYSNNMHEIGALYILPLPLGFLLVQLLNSLIFPKHSFYIFSFTAPTSYKQHTAHAWFW